MEMMLAFLHPFFALAARVSGTKINVTAAESRVRPPKSKSYQVRRRIPTRPVFRRLGLGDLIRFSLCALRWLRRSVRASGRKAAGKMIAHMP